MNARNIGYWITTALIALAFTAAGISDISRSPDVVAGITHLGYPLYLATLLGIWKLLAVPALLVPNLARLKEWAYAGIFFDLTGAAFSHASSGDPAGRIMTPLVVLAIAAASWALRPESRTLRSRSTNDADSIPAGNLASARS
jgi:uncharacterized membrane protein YphA (DoxX/SURF4 family)